MRSTLLLWAAALSTIHGLSWSPKNFFKPKRVEVPVEPKTTFVKESIKEFMAQNPRSPGFQRDIISERVLSLIETIKRYRKSQTPEDLAVYPVPFLNPLNVGKFNGTLFILDGQHRLTALQTIGINFDVCYTLKECETLDEMKEYFREINTHLPQEEIMRAENTMDALTEVKKYVNQKYNRHVSNSLKPLFPNVNVDHLSTYLIELLQREQSEGSQGELADVDCSDVIERLEEENERMGKVLKESDPELYEKASQPPKQGLFLANAVKLSRADKKSAAVEDAIATEPPKKKKRSTGLSKKLREALWKRDFGKNTEGECYACSAPINSFNFEAAHKLAVVNGGDDSKANLVCTCMTCNRESGTMNIDDWKKKIGTE